MANLRTLKSEKRYAGKVFNLLVDEIEYPSGNRGRREVAEHPGGAVVLPFLDEKTILLVRQFRYPTKEVLYELPAGKLEPGEDPEVCAKRELEEETGYTAGSMNRLTAIYTSPGFCTEKLHIFLATELRASARGQRLEEGESGLIVEKLPFDRAVAMVIDGTIVDAKTICGILIAEKQRSR